MSRDASLSRERSYLYLVAQAELHPLLRGRVEVSDLVQETLLEAHRDGEQLQGSAPAVRLAWLRRILTRNLANAVRGLQAQKRDAGREQPLEHALERSSLVLQQCLQAQGESPSRTLEKAEETLQVAEAFESLPEAQRTALALRYWQDWSLAEIGAHLGRSPAAVAALLHRGLRALRASMRALEQP